MWGGGRRCHRDGGGGLTGTVHVVTRGGVLVRCRTREDDGRQSCSESGPGIWKDTAAIRYDGKRGLGGTMGDSPVCVHQTSGEGSAWAVGRTSLPFRRAV